MPHEGAINCSKGFVFISPTIKIRHSHATETHCRDDRSTASKFSLFHIFMIRPSSSARSRNRQAMALRNFSIRRCGDDGSPASTRATFGEGNFSQSAAHKPYRRAPHDRDDEGAREFDECVRCAAGTQLNLPGRSSESRDTRFLLSGRGGKSPASVGDGPDVVRFSLRLPQPPCAVFRRQVRGKSVPRCAWRTVWTIPDAPCHFWPPRDSRLFPCRDGEQCRAVPFRRSRTASCSG